MLNKKYIDERDTEIKYLKSQYQKQKKILEIGISLADPKVLKYQIYLKKKFNCKLFAVDIIDYKSVINRFKNLEIDKHYKFKKQNILNLFFNNNFFDLVCLISTLEHVGFDKPKKSKDLKGVFERSKNKIKDIRKYQNQSKDYNALNKIYSKVKNGGNVIITVPFGSRQFGIYKDSLNLYSVYKEYSVSDIFNLVSKTKFSIKNILFYNKIKQNFKLVKNYDFKNIKFSKNVHDMEIKNIACINLQKN